MIIVPFDIEFPISILDKSKEINFLDPKNREDLFRRNMYYHVYESVRNPFLDSRQENYFRLTNQLLDYLSRNHHSLRPLSISIFGSSLFSSNPSDYDFLTIAEGDVFLSGESEFDLGGSTKTKVGISIKGITHFTGGFQGKDNSGKRLEQIVNRTAIALFRRNLPTWGYDFINNEETFLKNIYAQVSDLLSNTFNLYYSEDKNLRLTDSQRSKKILSRLYQVASYLDLSGIDLHIKEFRKKSYSLMNEGASLDISRKLFEEISTFYETRIKSSKSLGDSL